MAILLGNASSTNGTGLSATITGFAVVDLPCRIMIVATSVRRTANSISSITCNGKSFSSLGVVTGTNTEVEVWYLLMPDVGTYDVTVTWTGATPNEHAAGAFVYYGVHQTSPFGVLASTTGNSAAPSIAVASGENEVVIDAVSQQGSNAGAVALTVGANQTQLWQDAYVTTPKANSTTGASSYEAGAASVTMSWSSSASSNWAIGGVSLKPAPIATQSWCDV